MNYNLIAYLVYAITTVFIIWNVGRYCYNNGRVFILVLFKNDAYLTDQVNHLLLVAYYLFNLGYAFIRLKNWVRVVDMESLMSSLSNNLSILVLILATTHYLNMLSIYLLSKSGKFFNSSINHKL